MSKLIRSIKLSIIRKFKGLFLLLRLHALVGLVEDLLIFKGYLSKFSRWRAKHADLGHNDFFKWSVNYEDRFKLHQYVCNALQGETINYLEFGVGKGNALRWWLQHQTNPNSQFIGFDVFTGLPEDFGVLKKGHFSLGGALPDVNGDQRCSFVKGLFQDSLPVFLREGFDFSAHTNVIHLDADLYGSTLYVLTQLHPYLKTGDILIFDEFGVPTHEFKAFDDFCQAYRFNYQVIGAVNNYLQIALKVL